MADNFPLSTWDGVNSPWQNIQNWRVYGHSGSGTSNTGFRNYGATGVNTSSGVGTAQTWFKDGTPVQRTQYRAPSAGVQQRFTGDQIRSNTPPPMAPAIQGAIKGIQQGRQATAQAARVAEMKEKREEAIRQKEELEKQKRLYSINQSFREFKPPAPPSSPIKGSPAELSWRLREAFPQAYEPQPAPVERPDLAMSSKTQEIQERAKAWKANKSVQAPPAEQPSSSRASKRQQRVDRGVAAILSIGEWQKQQGALGAWSSKVE